MTYCPSCSEPLKLRLSDKLFFTCGHSFKIQELDEIEKQKFEKRFDSLTGEKSAYPYQKEGVDFIIRSADQGFEGFRALIADDMGLGKTIQALLALRAGGAEKFPCLIVVKSATTINWVREIEEWCSNHDFATFVIMGKAVWIPCGYDIYIVSMDSLARNVELDTYDEDTRRHTSKKQIRSLSPMYQIHWQSIVVDECHAFKETDTKRYQALKTLFEEIGIPNRIFLSGTPIKNRADEYYPTLHSLRPDLFPFFEHFKREWLCQNDKGAWSRIKPYKLNKFREITAPFILRRERSILNLPPHTHNEKIIEIEDERVKKAYNQQLDLFRLKVELGECNDPINTLAELAKLRRITGLAKVPFALEFAEEFFESAESDAEIDPDYPQKLTIGVHHHDVVNHIKLYCDRKYPQWGLMTLTGLTSMSEKDRVVERFRDKNRKLLACSTLAGGVGLNIQHCANYLILEKEWSPADENQFIGRFHRNGQTYPVVGTDLICAGTVDDFFCSLLREKRKVFGETIEGWSITADKGGLKRLVDDTLQGRL